MRRSCLREVQRRTICLRIVRRSSAPGLREVHGQECYQPEFNTENALTAWIIYGNRKNWYDCPASSINEMKHDDQTEENFERRMTEALVAADVACVLTFAFMDRLSGPGKTSLCLFSIAIPILVCARLDRARLIPGEPYLGKARTVLEPIAWGLSGIAFGALITGILLPAGACFAITLIAIICSRYKYFRIKKKKKSH